MAEPLTQEETAEGVDPYSAAPADSVVKRPITTREVGAPSAVPDIRLSSAQVALLKRITTGKKPVTSHEHWWCVDIHALRSRGLVRTLRSREGWTAQITDAGKSFLEQLGGREGIASATDTDLDCVAGPRLSAASVLRRVEAAGGVLVIADPDRGTRARWRRSLDVLVRDGLPDGRRLVYSGRSSGDLVITVAAKPSADSTAVPGGRKREPRRWNSVVHPLIQPLFQMTAETGAADRPVEPVGALGIRVPRVSRVLMPRALRLFSQLLTEAERRGHAVALSCGPAGHQGREVCVVVDGHEYPVRVEEQRGVLGVRLPGYCSGRRWWIDGTRAQVEDRVPEVLGVLEQRAEASACRRAERQRLAEQEQEQARERQRRAREAYRQDRACELLRGQVQAWRLAADIRALCGTVRGRIRDGSADAWLAWADALADRVDPLTYRLVIPEVPEPESAELERYASELSDQEWRAP